MPGMSLLHLQSKEGKYSDMSDFTNELAAIADAVKVYTLLLYKLKMPLNANTDKSENSADPKDWGYPMNLR